MTKKNMRNVINKIMESENTITYTDYIGRLICSLYDDDYDDKNEIREHVRKLFNNCFCTDYNTILINTDVDNDVYLLINIECNTCYTIQLGIFDILDVQFELPKFVENIINNM